MQKAKAVKGHCPLLPLLTWILKLDIILVVELYDF